MYDYGVFSNWVLKLFCYDKYSAGESRLVEQDILSSYSDQVKGQDSTYSAREDFLTNSNGFHLDHSKQLLSSVGNRDART